MILCCSDGVQVQLCAEDASDAGLFHDLCSLKLVEESTPVSVPFEGSVVTLGVRALRGESVVVPHESMARAISFSSYARIDPWTTELLEQARFCPIRLLFELPISIQRQCISLQALVEADLDSCEELSKQLLEELGRRKLPLGVKTWTDAAKLIKSAWCSSCTQDTHAKDPWNKEFRLCTVCCAQGDYECITLSTALKTYKVPKSRLLKLPSITVLHPLSLPGPRPKEKKKPWMNLFRRIDVEWLRDKIRRETFAADQTFEKEVGAASENARENVEVQGLEERPRKRRKVARSREGAHRKKGRHTMTYANDSDASPSDQESTVDPRFDRQAQAIENNLKWLSMFELLPDLEPLESYLGCLGMDFLYGYCDKTHEVWGKLVHAWYRLWEIRDYILGYSVNLEDICGFVAGTVSKQKTLQRVLGPHRRKEVLRLTPPHVVAHRRLYVRCEIDAIEFARLEKVFQAAYRLVEHTVAPHTGEKVRIEWKEVTTTLDDYLDNNFEKVFGPAQPSSPPLSNWRDKLFQVQKHMASVHFASWEPECWYSLKRTAPDFDEVRALRVGAACLLFGIQPNSLNLTEELSKQSECKCIYDKRPTTDEILAACEYASSASQAKTLLGIHCWCEKRPLDTVVTEWLSRLSKISAWPPERLRDSLEGFARLENSESLTPEQAVAYAQLGVGNSSVSKERLDQEYEAMGRRSRSYIVALERVEAK